MSSNSSGKRLEGFLTGKGFYIVLFLCAAVIGVSAWTMAAGNEAMEDLTQANNAVLDNRRVETVIIAPEATAKVETAAVEEEAMESVVEIEPPVEVQPVWNEAETVTVWPVQGELERLHDVQTLHYDVTLRDWRTHAGIDILAPLGETVRAAMSGTVQSVVEDGLYGTVVTIDHGDGTQAVYANLAALPAVATGDYVSAGDVIGAVGDTALCEIGQGTHLHFAMMLDGASVNPLDYLPA
ncbi:MAG: M23 family metallopeptidase [Oscillospiraceae bacterium]|nr:M23 family metallopeptidase [Oscillospiraceae bacterium]